MVERERANGQSIYLNGFPLLDLMKIPFCGNLSEADRKVRHCHLPLKRFPQRPPRRSGNERYAVCRSIKGGEEGYSLNMVPMEVRQKYGRVDRLTRRFLKHRLAKRAQAAAPIENNGVVFSGLNLQARRVAAKLQVFPSEALAWSRVRPRSSFAPNHYPCKRPSSRKCAGRRLPRSCFPKDPERFSGWRLHAVLAIMPHVAAQGQAAGLILKEVASLQKRRHFIRYIAGATGALAVGWSILPPRQRLIPGGPLPLAPGQIISSLAGLRSPGDDTVTAVSDVAGRDGPEEYLPALAMLLPPAQYALPLEVKLEQSTLDRIYNNQAEIVDSLPFQPDDDGYTKRAGPADALPRSFAKFPGHWEPADLPA